MKKKTVKYAEGPIKEIRVVEDVLPSPEYLIMKGETVKVTLSLTKESVDFFKDEAEMHHTQYQKLIRTLLDQYSNYYGQKRKR